MDDAAQPDGASGEIERQAAAWVLRRDRGLTAVEQDAFSQWLAADPRHGAQFARHRAHWGRLDQLVHWRPEHAAYPNPDLLAPPLWSRLRGRASVVLPLAAAAAAAILLAVLWHPEARRPESNSSVTMTAPAEKRQTLPDGSIIELNRGAVVTVRYTPAQRRVILERGEAHFTVAKNAARPFIVSAHGIDVRAVGTAFNVRMDATAVEVLVTEGHVQVKAAPPSPSAPAVPPLVPLLGANQRAVLSLLPRPEAPQIATLTPEEIERVLSWEHRLLDFTATPLADIVAEFNRWNTVQLVVSDRDLASIRISASFRADNIDGFIRLLELGFGVRAEHRGASEILLHKVR